MKRIIRWGVDNSPAVNTVMIGVLLVGMVSMLSMRREVFPEFDLEIILVSVPYPGASPDEVEQGICQKIEEAVRSIDGIKKQTAVAQEGSGFLVLELEANTDVQKTLNDVRSEIDRIPSFPELAEDPETKQLTLREPAIRVAVMGPREDSLQNELLLREVAEKVRSDLLQLPSVSQANIEGSREYQIDVEIPEDRLRKYDLSLQEVAARIRGENLELPGGSIKTRNQELLLRGKNKRLRGDEIDDIPLITQPNGVVLSVSDLGTVRDAFEDVTSISEVNGQPALVITVDRTKSEDLLAMVDEVKDYAESASVPAGFELTTFADRSIEVRDRMDLLIRNGLQGLALVFLMLTIFMNLRLSFWVALGIPIAVLGAGGVLLYCGQTLNMLSMFAFLMALGIVVDDAIVIGENIFTHRQEGMPGVQAAITGTLEVLPSVLASVTTTIIAFTPLLFVSGVMGKFIAVMPVAVIAMLCISLVESTFILPCHLAHSGGDNALLRFYRWHSNRPIAWQLIVGIVLTATAILLVHGAYPFALSTELPPARITMIAGAVRIVLAVMLASIVVAYPLLRFTGFVEWMQEKSAQALSFAVERWYVPHLHWSVRHPAIVICASLSLAVASCALVTSGKTPFIIFPKTDNNQIQARVTFPDGTPASVTDAATKKLMDAILRLDERYVAQRTIDYCDEQATCRTCHDVGPHGARYTDDR